MATPKYFKQSTSQAILTIGLLNLFVPFALPMFLCGLRIAEVSKILIAMSFNVILGLIVVPFRLWLPCGRGSFQDYLASNGVKSRFPVPNGLTLDVLAFSTWGILMYGEGEVITPSLLKLWWCILLSLAVPLGGVIVSTLIIKLFLA